MKRLDDSEEGVGEGDLRGRARVSGRVLRRWVPLALPVAMCWLVYANVSAFRSYQQGVEHGVSGRGNREYYPLKIHKKSWARPHSLLARGDYYWLQDVLRGTTLILPAGAKVDEGLLRHFALVTPVFGTHGKIDSRVAAELVEGANTALLIGVLASIAGPPRTPLRRVYIPESFESLRGKRVYWIVEQSSSKAKAGPRTFMVSHERFRDLHSTPP